MFCFQSNRLKNNNKKNNYARCLAQIKQSKGTYVQVELHSVACFVNNKTFKWFPKQMQDVL